MPRVLALAPIALACVASPSTAQVGLPWADVDPDGQIFLGPEPGDVSDIALEVDFAWADLDNNSYVDLVVARKQPFTTPGGAPNLLLMNVGGLLVDRTELFASASDVPGDLGFLTATRDRDVQIADVTGDGLLDVVTAPALSDGAAKAFGHPRVYVNQGLVDDFVGWRGLEYQEARIPQLFHHVTGLPQNPRFTELAVGDLNLDGAPDLYFADHDSSAAGGALEPPGADLGDRILINNGIGFFTDASAAVASVASLDTDFGASAQITDLNGDGLNDVARVSHSGAAGVAAALYNAALSPGQLAVLDPFHFDGSRHIAADDLNNDGLVDVVIPDLLADRVLYNLGNDGLQRVVWSAPVAFGFLFDADDGAAGNTLVVDLDNDGWKDVIVCDVDDDIPGFGRRAHIYHNPGGVPGSLIQLVEEREFNGPGGWVGLPGIQESDLQGTFDVAAFDVENDGDVDLLFGRADGTFVYENELLQPVPGPKPLVKKALFNQDGSSELTFEQAASALNGDVDLRITDNCLVVPEHYEHLDFELWRVIVHQRTTHELRAVLPEHTTQPVEYETETGIGSGGVPYRRMIVRWRDCVVPGGEMLPPPGSGPERIDVEVRAEFRGASRVAEFTLHVDPRFVDHAIYSARHAFSIEKVSRGQDEALLAPGFLVENPTVNLDSENIGILDFQDLPGVPEPADPFAALNFEFRPLADVSAYIRKGRGGVIFYSGDPTGRIMKDYRYGGEYQPGKVDAFRLEVVYGADDVYDEQLEFHSPAPMYVGPFEPYGPHTDDWWRPADLYRTWLWDQGNPTGGDPDAIGASGLIASRTDVSERRKGNQQAFVWGPLDVRYDTLVPNPLTGLPSVLTYVDLLKDYKAKYGLDRLSLLQFDVLWAQGGCISGIGEYALDAPNWGLAGNAGLITDFDSPGSATDVVDSYSLYVLDHFFDTGASWYSSGVPGGGSWSSHETRTLTGGTIDLLHFCLEDLSTHTLRSVDVASSVYQQHMQDVAEDLASNGVSGLYIDNFFWDIYSTNLDPTQLEVGFRDAYGAFADTFASILDADELSSTPGGVERADFSLYSEVLMPAYIPVAGVAGPAQLTQDFVSGGEHVRLVPLHPYLYHHLATQGPARAEWYLRVAPYLPTTGRVQEVDDVPDHAASASFDPGTGGIASSLERPMDTSHEEAMTASIFSKSPQERAAGVLGACYTYAWGWVNGSPLWPADLALFVDNPAFGFPSGSAPFGHEFDLYRAIVEYSAGLASMRSDDDPSKDHLGPFLGTGIRMHDLESLAREPDTVRIPLTPLDGGEETEYETMPRLQQGVYRDAVTADRLAMVVTNPSMTATEAQPFRWSAEDYAQNPAFHYDLFWVDAKKNKTRLDAQSGTTGLSGSGEHVIHVPPLGPREYGAILIEPRP